MSYGFDDEVSDSAMGSVLRHLVDFDDYSAETFHTFASRSTTLSHVTSLPELKGSPIPTFSDFTASLDFNPSITFENPNKSRKKKYKRPGRHTALLHSSSPRRLARRSPRRRSNSSTGREKSTKWTEQKLKTLSHGVLEDGRKHSIFGSFGDEYLRQKKATFSKDGLNGDDICGEDAEVDDDDIADDVSSSSSADNLSLPPFHHKEKKKTILKKKPRITTFSPGVSGTGTGTPLGRKSGVGFVVGAGVNVNADADVDVNKETRKIQNDDDDDDVYSRRRIHSQSQSQSHSPTPQAAAPEEPVFGHVSPGKRPKFVLPFSPVKNSTYVDDTDSTKDIEILDSARLNKEIYKINHESTLDVRRKSIAAKDEFLTVKDRCCYFGKKSRQDYFYMYKQISKQNLTIPNASEVLSSAGRSPRSEFLREIVKNQLTPWPILRRNLNNPRNIDLNGKGLGDEVVIALTKVLENLPSLDTLLLADNRLTDDSLHELCDKVTKMPNITELDISYNDIDDSSKSILEYLKHDDCALKSLSMEHADVDDFECGDMMIAMEKNTSLLTLDLKDNLIGEKEQLNVVMPELITGGEAIAEMITINQTLTHLDVSWNSIRGDSAMELAVCLEKNHSIKTLIMAHNAFGDLPSQFLGDALTRNDTLMHLDLSFNGVSPSAAMVIASSLRVNKSICLLNLSGNTIGKRGAESLMQSLRRATRVDNDLVIEINNCDCEYIDPTLFDPVEPENVYKLKMDEPYSRMVAGELLRMANSKPGAFFKSVRYAPPNGGELKELPLVHSETTASNVAKKSFRKSSVIVDEWKIFMVKIMDELGDGVIDDPTQLNHDLTMLLKKMKLYPNTDTVDRIMWALDLTNLREETLIDTIFRSIFQMVDLDHGKSVDRGEMKRAMTLLGVRINDDQADRIIAEYDVDKSGEIEEDEFVSWMANTYCKPNEIDKSPVRLNGERWTPPEEGLMVVDFKADRMPPSTSEVGTDEGVNRLIENIQHAATPSEREKLFDKATSNSDIFMTSGQAQKLMDICPHGEEIDTILRLLPQMLDPQQSCQLVEGNLTIDQIILLKKRMGPAFNVVLGNATGRYMLDLENPLHRIAARKLGELNNFEKRFSKSKSGRGDTSQKGTWDNFRNESINKELLKLDSHWFNKIPQFGKLRFDYISTTRHSKASKPMSEKRFKCLLDKLRLDYVEVIRQWYSEYEYLINRRHEEEWIRLQDEEEKKQKKALDEAEKSTRLRGAVVKVISAVKMDRIMQRKTKNSLKATPAVDALTRGARSMGFYEKDSKDTLDTRLQTRRGGVDASLFAPAKLLEMQNSPKGENRRVLSVLGEPVRRRSIILEDYEDEQGLSTHKEDHVVYDSEDSSDDEDRLDESRLLKFHCPFRIPDCLTVIESTSHWRDFRESSHQRFNYYRKENARDKDKIVIEKTAEEKFADLKFEKATPSPAYLALYYLLQRLQCVAFAAKLSIRQAMTIVDAFPRQEFARVQAIIILHRSIVESDKFHFLFRLLDESELRELVHRVGWLNIFNPEYPDRLYNLDLRYADHRKMTEMLSILAVEEPGENWLDEEYRWSSYDDPVPGWTLPNSWTGRVVDTDNAGNCGPRDFGRLFLEYTSEPQYDCAPVWSIREGLKNRVLCGTKLSY